MEPLPKAMVNEMGSGVGLIEEDKSAEAQREEDELPWEQIKIPKEKKTKKDRK
jgi:hypothetical protein